MDTALKGIVSNINGRTAQLMIKTLKDGVAPLVEIPINIGSVNIGDEVVALFYGASLAEGCIVAVTKWRNE